MFICFLGIQNAHANQGLAKADSLFSERKYTEAFEAYEDIFIREQTYTPQMLLKMSFIKEGLGNYSKALYYLSILQQKQPSPNLQEKINTLANKQNLRGYGNQEEQFVRSFLTKHNSIVTYGLFGSTALSFFIFSLILLLKNKTNYVFLVVFVLGMGLSYALNLFITETKFGIINNSNTYCMSAPSSASTVISLTDNAGDFVKIIDKVDVWYKVEQEGILFFVHQNNILALP
ncbi:MAG: hypothetical protein GY827_00585 [Cytophagales bacterium]|nr:hypothetical protein [Cytophagales bacterium]